MPDTVIDYPVLQPKNHDDDYYLHHNLQKKYSFAGCIYSRKDNAMDFSDDITVLYGHNMINGSMFAGIKKFSDEDFLKLIRQFMCIQQKRCMNIPYGLTV